MPNVIAITALAVSFVALVLLAAYFLLRRQSQGKDQFFGTVRCHKNGCVQNATGSCDTCGEAFCSAHKRHSTHAGDAEENKPAEWELES